MWKVSLSNPKYEVSDLGEIRAVKSKRIRKQSVSIKTGYSKVNTWLDYKTVTIPTHREVAKLFIPNPLNKPEVNHIDGNKQNNSVTNLEWVTNQENTIHGFEHGFAVSNTLGKKQGDSSQYHSVSFDPTKQRYVASVYDRTTKKPIRKYFALAKYEDAEIQAAKAVNQILDSLGDTIRPRNKV